MSREQKRQKRAQDFKNQKIKQASDFNFNQHGKNHVSQQELNFLRKNNLGENGKQNLKDNYAALTKAKESGATFSKRAQAQYDNMGNRLSAINARQSAKEKAKTVVDKPKTGGTGQPTNPIDDTTTGDNDVVPSNTEITNTQTQEVNQDNDINTTVNGNNNTVVNNQDNSIRQYGGDNRSFVYNGGKDGIGAASAATLSGFFDVDDSPAAQAKFNDMHTTMNRDNQKRFAGQGLATAAQYSNFDARSYTNESMENYLNKSTQYSYDRADRQTGLVFGDIWNPNYITEEWKMPTPPKAIESNAADIADKAKEDIEDI